MDYCTPPPGLEDLLPSDHELCSRALAGDVPGMRRKILELQQQYNPLKLSHEISLCIAARKVEEFKVLLEYVKVDEDIAEDAARSGNLEIYRVILDHGWPINHSLRKGWIPSMLSHAVHDLDLVEWLLAQGADPNPISLLNGTALSSAIHHGPMEVIKKLIAVGTDISRGDLLHCAARRKPSSDTKEIIDMLVRRGVRLDTHECDNEVARMFRYGFALGTPLHTACYEQNLLAAEALLEHGADPFALKKKFEDLVPPTALQLAPLGSPMRALLDRHIAGRQASQALPSPRGRL